MKRVQNWGKAQASPGSFGPAKPSRQRSPCQFGAGQAPVQRQSSAGPARIRRERTLFLQSDRAPPCYLPAFAYLPPRRLCDRESAPFPAESKRGRRPAGAHLAPNAAACACRTASSPGQGQASFPAARHPAVRGQRTFFPRTAGIPGSKRSPCNLQRHACAPWGGQRAHFRPLRNKDSIDGRKKRQKHCRSGSPRFCGDSPGISPCGKGQTARHAGGQGSGSFQTRVRVRRLHKQSRDAGRKGQEHGGGQTVFQSDAFHLVFLRRPSPPPGHAAPQAQAWIACRPDRAGRRGSGKRRQQGGGQALERAGG